MRPHFVRFQFRETANESKDCQMRHAGKRS